MVRTRDQLWSTKKIEGKLKEISDVNDAMKSRAHHNQVADPLWHTLDHAPSGFVFLLDTCDFFQLLVRDASVRRVSLG